MLSVFVCEDDEAQRERIVELVKDNIMIEEYQMEMTLATSNPYEVLQYLEKNENTRGIYFLDVDLQQAIDGIQLGVEIRKKDVDAKIIFITTHSELQGLVFTYKVEAMDYIDKEDITLLRKRVQECLQLANEYYTKEDRVEAKRVKIKINNQIRVFSLEDIMFFETTHVPRKLTLHLRNSTIDLHGSLKELENLSDAFIRIHKSFLVNKENIHSFDLKKREVMMENGATCFVSVRGRKLIN
ncbi:two-component system, LytTR family, response regulator AgrA [Enterococcus sp. AZ194]|uniref:LytR/AlgR family response regulator transcription factor n=1 Tax=Enterococcus sp. AZ194 TaxID=2774629 RepID=UPI003F298898